MSDRQIYQKFINYMSNPAMEFTKSDYLMPMIESHISPEEAEFLTGFPFLETSLDEIAAMKKMDPDEVLSKIKPLLNKVFIYEAINGETVKYKLWSIFDMFLRYFHIDREGESAKTMANYRNKYFMDGWHSQLKHFKHQELRAIPINETIDSGTEILPYEDIIKVVDDYEYYSVSECACRTLHKHDPDFEESPYPSEVCLHFDEFGRYFVANGLGREITKEETFEILKKAADAGLVHAISNVEDAERSIICNCDMEYCVFTKPYHQLNFDASLDKSNYLVEVTEEACKACGLCAKRCPMDAIQFKFSTKSTNKSRKAMSVNEDLCIGCGVCVHKCKNKAITLKLKVEITRPPKDYAFLRVPNLISILEAKAKEGGHGMEVIAAKYAAKLGWSQYQKRPELMTKAAKFVTDKLSKKANSKR